MSMDSEGYIGDSAESYRICLASKYDKVFSLYREINRYLHKFKFRLTPKDTEDRKIIIVAFFTKALDCFQGIYILGNHGLGNDAESCLRDLFEILVRMHYCCTNEQAYRKYLAQHYHKIKSWINEAIRDPKNFPDEMKNKAALEKRLQEQDDNLAQLGNPPKISIQEMADECGLKKYYNVFYRPVCDNVHANAYALQQYLEVDKHNNIKGFKWGPPVNENNVPITLITSVDFMLNILRRIATFFDLDITNDLEKPKAKLLALN